MGSVPRQQGHRKSVPRQQRHTETPGVSTETTKTHGDTRGQWRDNRDTGDIRGQ